MNTFRPVCWFCGETYEIEPIYTCRRCKGTLDIQYDYKQVFSQAYFQPLASAAGNEIGRFRELLPVWPNQRMITLGEGGTPLIRTNNLFNTGNNQSLFLKLESVNPTLAFKDRPLAVAMTAAVQFGLNEVVCASTGNTGVAAAAYAARAGLRCAIYVPEGTPEEKRSAMEQYGAVLHTVKGHYSDAYRVAEEMAAARQAFNLTSTYMNPYAVEGNKTVAYELAFQLGKVPDWIIVPIGAGPLLSGIYKGFKEMKLAGFTDKLPRMAGVQAEGCAPIVRAFRDEEIDVQPWSDPAQTIASGIADPLITYPADGTRTLSVIRESEGIALAIADEELIRYRRLLAEREGVLAELSSVTAVAAAAQMQQTGLLEQSATIISIVTGHGLKDMSAAINHTKGSV
ncbi:threonine synthase [Paenibacillus paeoniae]|uniref:Threonine synthase n=1 Tax=Paenibacillus paeoniae TaxID=2292705 RepID=A0A371NZT9_9BACL|nr:threonine synthase [Paenibacillus paeoniae]REK69193.1 threonine synthase [Paenibacillus paeoniae]